MHDVISGKAITGCSQLADKTPMMWNLKKQATTQRQLLVGLNLLPFLIDVGVSLSLAGMVCFPLTPLPEADADGDGMKDRNL